MSDETTRPEDEVEAHGPFAEGPTAEGPTAEGPTAEATDDEPDVEAHGPFAEGPTRRGSRRQRVRPPSSTAPPLTVSRGPGAPGPLSFFLCAERSRQVIQELQPGLALLVLEGIYGGRQACDDGEVATSVPEERFGATRLEEQVDGDRRLVREQPEELHLLRG